LRRSALLALGATACYFAAAYSLKTTYDPVLSMPNSAGRKVLIQRPYASFSGSRFAVIAPDDRYAEDADSSEDSLQSAIVIYEDGTPLGPAHTTPHEEIAMEGRGRFSHWRDHSRSAFVFSSSDNTDPRTNGRSYWAVSPPAAVYPVPKGKIVVRMKKPFETFKGSYMVVDHALGSLTEFADYPNHYYRSPIVLYEDDHPLGPAHSAHTDIAFVGEGRFSYWKPQGMVFSSSDNSNPNTNGRRYWAVLPEEPGR